MDAARVRILQKSRVPKTYPCPQCGKRGRRKGTHTRRVRDIAYGQIVFIELTVGEYRAACTCCKTFRCRVKGIEPRVEYTNRVRDAVIDRLLDDGMSLHRVQQAMRRDFLLELSDGFLHDCLDWKVRQTDMPGYRQWTLKHFSGTLCIDELHLGHRTRLLATDPLGDFPVAFALVSAAAAEEFPISPAQVRRRKQRRGDRVPAPTTRAARVRATLTRDDRAGPTASHVSRRHRLRATNSVRY